MPNPVYNNRVQTRNYGDLKSQVLITMHKLSFYIRESVKGNQ